MLCKGSESGSRSGFDLLSLSMLNAAPRCSSAGEPPTPLLCWAPPPPGRHHRLPYLAVSINHNPGRKPADWNTPDLHMAARAAHMLALALVLALVGSAAAQRCELWQGACHNIVMRSHRAALAAHRSPPIRSM